MPSCSDPPRFFFEGGARGANSPAPGEGEVQALLRFFFEQTEKDDLYHTALTLESLNDRRAVPPLIHALLEDGNPHRRHAAARLGLDSPAGPGRSACAGSLPCGFLTTPTGTRGGGRVTSLRWHSRDN